MIKKVVKFTNGTVAVFDENGKQMPDYQGMWSEKAGAIKADADLDTEFEIIDWNTEVKPFL